MAFIQLMEFTTSKIDQVNELFEEWLKATEGKRTAQKLVLTKGRDANDTYIEIVEFPSYGEAMKNSLCSYFDHPPLVSTSLATS